MKFLNDWIKNDPSGTIVTFFLVFTVIIISLVLIAYLVDHKKNKQNLENEEQFDESCSSSQGKEP